MRLPIQSLAPGRADRRRFFLLVLGFVLAGFTLRLGAALVWPKTERPDEIFQNLEPAYRLWTGRGIVTWEWREGIRSLLFPEMLAGIMRLTGLLHLPERAALPAIWAVLSLLSCGTIVVGVALGWRRYGTIGAVLCGILTAFWPDLVYFGPKTLVEVQAGNLVVIAAGLAMLGADANVSPANVLRDRSRLFGIGLLLGAAFALRFQVALALALIACWSAQWSRLRWGWLIVGALIPVLALGLLDWVTLGSPFQSIWKNVAVNFFQNKAADFGVSPIYNYAFMLLSRHGAVILVLAALFAAGFRAAPLPAWVAIVVIVFHSAIGHKEISFIYAALPCVMIVAGLGLARLVTDRALRGQPPRPGRALALVTAVTCATIGAIAISAWPFAPVSPEADLRSLWSYARAAPDLCGLELFTDDPDLWGRSGGQSALARPVPIYMALSPAAFAASRQAFNYVVAYRFVGDMVPGLEKVHCHGDYCLFHQPVQCHPDPDHEMSAELARSGK